MDLSKSASRRDALKFGLLRSADAISDAPPVRAFAVTSASMSAAFETAVQTSAAAPAAPVVEAAVPVQPRPPVTSTHAPAETASSSSAVSFATILSLVAAVINLRVAPENLANWWGYGAIYLLSGVAGLALVGLLQRRASGAVLQAGIWGSLVMLLMYLVSHTGGIPFGPDTGLVRAVDPLGAVAAVAEAGLVVVLCGLLASRARRRTLNLLAVVGVALWAAAFAGVLTPSSQPVNGSVHSLGSHFSSSGSSPRPLPAIPNSVRNAPRPNGAG